MSLIKSLLLKLLLHFHCKILFFYRLSKRIETSLIFRSTTSFFCDFFIPKFLIRLSKCQIGLQYAYAVVDYIYFNMHITPFHVKTDFI